MGKVSSIFNNIREKAEKGETPPIGTALISKVLSERNPGQRREWLHSKFPKDHLQSLKNGIIKCIRNNNNASACVTAGGASPLSHPPSALPPFPSLSLSSSPLSLSLSRERVCKAPIWKEGTLFHVLF